ncbi:MAG: hypothetical protein ACI9B9_001512, partial [Halioglobus sp.]
MIKLRGYFLRLATPTKPIRAEPNNHAAAGTGTADGDMVGLPSTSMSTLVTAPGVQP